MSDDVFAFDKTAQAIAALHTNRELRSVCHEQIVRALRDVKNAAIPTDEVAQRARADALEEAAKVAETRWATLSVGKVAAHLQPEVERNAIAASIRALITTTDVEGDSKELTSL